MSEQESNAATSLRIAISIGDAHWKRHFANADNDRLPAADRQAALDCAAAVGMLIADLKRELARVVRSAETSKGAGE